MCAAQAKKDVTNRAICTKCNSVVPTHHERRDGKVYLVKECPDCGNSEVSVSSDAARYDEKRQIIGYPDEALKSCSLNCRDCKIHKPPTLVFIDVTNRCNMNCPICLANIPAMGFRFDPPMAYFEKIFQKLASMDPKPKIQLFGGEPTVRKDLLDLIDLAHEKYDLNCRVVTNGLRLADEDYCKKLMSKNVQVMFSFDGRSPEIYEATRKHPKAFEKKLKGLENAVKFGKNKITIMTCVAEQVNAKHMPDMIELCHEHRGRIAALDLIPLTAHWGPEAVDVESATIEDVERIMNDAIPGMEFIPASLAFKLKTLYEVFGTDRITFGGAHPNCESVSILISDGEKYHPASKFLTRPFQDVANDLIAMDEQMAAKVKKSWIARLLGEKGRKLLYSMALFKFARRNFNLREIFGGSPTLKTLKILLGLLGGKKAKHVLRANTRCHHILRVIILPFEEPECVEAARLVDCPAAFAFEHPESKEIHFMPVCSWPIYKDDILRETAENYGVAGKDAGDLGMETLSSKEAAQKTASPETNA